MIVLEQKNCNGSFFGFGVVRYWCRINLYWRRVREEQRRMRGTQNRYKRRAPEKARGAGRFRERRKSRIAALFLRCLEQLLRVQLGLPGIVNRFAQDAGGFLRAVKARAVFAKDKIPAQLRASNQVARRGKLLV